MKKTTYVLSLVLILMLVMSMAGCGKDTTKATEKESAVVTTKTAETTKENVADVKTAETTKENEVAAELEGDQPSKPITHPRDMQQCMFPRRKADKRLVFDMTAKTVRINP